MYDTNKIVLFQYNVKRSTINTQLCYIVLKGDSLGR